MGQVALLPAFLLSHQPLGPMDQHLLVNFPLVRGSRLATQPSLASHLPPLVVLAEFILTGAFSRMFQAQKGLTAEVLEWHLDCVISVEIISRSADQRMSMRLCARHEYAFIPEFRST